jgi:hypothetical protein
MSESNPPAPRCGARFPSDTSTPLACDRPVGHYGNHSVWTGIGGHANWPRDPAPAPSPQPAPADPAGASDKGTP